MQHFKCKLIRKSKLTRHKRFAYEGCLHSRVRALNPTKIGFFPNRMMIQKCCSNRAIFKRDVGDGYGPH